VFLSREQACWCFSYISSTKGQRRWAFGATFVLRLSSSPVVSIAKIRGPHAGIGNVVLACDMRFASRQSALFGKAAASFLRYHFSRKVRPAGLPTCLPVRRACAIRAFTLSRSGSRWNSPTAPRI
jgi:hypothetical protein